MAKHSSIAFNETLSACGIILSNMCWYSRHSVFFLCRALPLPEIYKIERFIHDLNKR